MENPFSLAGKHVLVTGAGSGIGRAISVMASNMGANLVLVDIRQDLMDETILLLKGEGHTSIQADLSVIEQVKAIVEKVEKKKTSKRCFSCVYFLFSRTLYVYSC